MAERAVLPVENSLGGSIHAVFDLLLRYRLHIVGETSLAINHCLVALPGTRLQDLRRVMSHPQALAQCDVYLRRLGVVKEAVDDTAGAAQLVARQQMEGVAAICSRRAAELYGLDVLEEGIQVGRALQCLLYRHRWLAFCGGFVVPHDAEPSMPRIKHLHDACLYKAGNMYRAGLFGKLSCGSVTRHLILPPCSEL